jgi:DNA-binding FadR family transcriptional regulator
MIELAEQFGVSRAVVHDTTRILMAQGLVEVKHGLGVFVTPPQNEAFGEALLLARRRAGRRCGMSNSLSRLSCPRLFFYES